MSHMSCQLDHVKIQSDGNQSFTVLHAVCAYNKDSPNSEEFIISMCNKLTDVLNNEKKTHNEILINIVNRGST